MGLKLASKIKKFPKVIQYFLMGLIVWVALFILVGGCIFIAWLVISITKILPISVFLMILIIAATFFLGFIIIDGKDGKSN